MSEDHFTLDIDPEGVRAAHKSVQELEGALRHKGVQAKNTPGNIGEEWTGEAADTVKGEMTGLGTLMMSWATKLHGAETALASLADDYDEALAQLPALNRKWNEAQTEYERACARADAQFDESRDSSPAGSNRGLEHEFSDIRTQAKNSAAEARRTEHYNLEYSFGMTRVWLAQQTRACGASLAEASPFDVPESALADLANGRFPSEPFDHSDVTSGLAMTEQYHENRREEHEQAERQAAREEAITDIEGLNEALENGDSEAVQEYLDKIGEKTDEPPYYSEELVRELGPEGLQDLYERVDRSLIVQELTMEDVWPSLSNFNDTVAHGISSLPDAEFSPYLEEWMSEGYGPKMWAMIAGSEQADGRVNATALAYQSEIYNVSLSSSMGMPGLFPQVFNYVYEDDMLDQWDERSSGADLADVLEHASPEHRDDLMFRLMNIQVDGGTMNHDQWQHLADLYGETLVELKDRHLDALNESVGARPDLLMEILDWRNRNAGQYGYTDPFAPYLEQLVRDPEWALWYLNNSRDGFVPASTFKDLIAEAEVDPNQLIVDMTTFQIDRGDNPEQVATNLGLLMRERDILGENIDYSGVLKSVVKSAIGAGVKSPWTGPVVGVLDALWSEFERLEALDQSLDGAMDKNAAQEVMAFFVYTEQHGGPPPGFDSFVAEEGLESDERAVNLYFQHLEQQGGSTWEELQNLTTLIDESRDEE